MKPRCCRRSFRSACQFIRLLKLIIVTLALFSASSWHNHGTCFVFTEALHTHSSKPIKTDREIGHRLAFKSRNLSTWERKLLRSLIHVIDMSYRYVNSWYLYLFYASPFFCCKKPSVIHKLYADFIFHIWRDTSCMILQQYCLYAVLNWHFVH